MALMTKEFLTEFIEIFRGQECLWNVKTKHYYDRCKKEAGYDLLVDKMKRYDPHATRELAVKKINNMRSAFRKEHKKVMKSRAAAEDPDDVYQPKLWYYTQLLFLHEQDGQHNATPDESEKNNNSCCNLEDSSLSNLESIKQERIDEDEESDFFGEEYDDPYTTIYGSEEELRVENPKRVKTTQIYNVPTETTNARQYHLPTLPVNNKRPKPIQFEHSENEQPTKRRKVTHHATKVHAEDEFETFTKHIASQLRLMPLDRALWCEKEIHTLLINERIRHINMRKDGTPSSNRHGGLLNGERSAQAPANRSSSELSQDTPNDNLIYALKCLDD